MAKMTADLARSLFAYDPESGLLRWKIGPNRKVTPWSIAGTISKRGYVRVMYSRRSYMAHCIAWTIVHGTWPSDDLDHKDRTRSNNRISNLRLATKSQNSTNSGLSKVNTSGFKGVSFAKKKGKWWARIRVNGRRISLGLFDTAKDASNAYKAAEALYHGEWGTYADESSHSARGCAIADSASCS